MWYLLQRANQKALAQHWRWIAFPAGLLLVSSIFLLGHWHDRGHPKFEYHDLLMATNADNCRAPIHLGGTSRLVRTLEANERRYQQHMLVGRANLIEKEGGDQIAVFPPPFGRYYVLWDFFIPAFTCPFPMDRVGVIADGGKWVCGLERVLHHRPNCIVYSLNKDTPSYSSFEQDILERSSGCEIYAFDANTAPSKWPWGETEVVATDLLRSRVHFNEFTVSDVTAKHYRSLESVMRGFGHEWIDVLKVDLKGSEFATLLAIIADHTQQLPLPFGQLILTVNIGASEDMKTVAQFSDWFTRLECAGLRPYYFEVSMMDVNNRRGEPGVAYWSFMNIRGTHELVDDSLPEYP